MPSLVVKIERGFFCDGSRKVGDLTRFDLEFDELVRIKLKANQALAEGSS